MGWWDKLILVICLVISSVGLSCFTLPALTRWRACRHCRRRAICETVVFGLPIVHQVLYWSNAGPATLWIGIATVLLQMIGLLVIWHSLGQKCEAGLG
jgi:hypothetical protein